MRNKEGVQIAAMGDEEGTDLETKVTDDSVDRDEVIIPQLKQH